MRYCLHPGCAAMVKSGRCATHQTQAYRRDQYARGTAAQRGYGAKWRRLRNKKLRANPLCELCEKQGRTTAAVEVDHIVPKPKGSDAWANLQSICRRCHALKTAGERDGGV